ncbi:hypothetical protein MRB53_005792 [Persea americana]|uniref:Uncharacterized protein n=1 Tax=Persea americana TaxID=3435 RepID=A0ACC2MEJ6_PERAE|nr:hypothetical protein MRB53_005792 [Persea americana]
MTPPEPSSPITCLTDADIIQAMCPHTVGDTITARWDDQIFVQGLSAYKVHESIPLLTNWPRPSGWYDDASACLSAISIEVCRLNKGPEFEENPDDKSSISYKSEDDYAFITELPQLLGPLSSLSKTDSDKEDTIPLSFLFKATEGFVGPGPTTALFWQNAFLHKKSSG